MSDIDEEEQSEYDDDDGGDDDDDDDNGIDNEIYAIDNINFTDFTEYLGKPKEFLDNLSKLKLLSSSKNNCSTRFDEDNSVVYKIFENLDFRGIKDFLREVEITYRTSHPCTLQLLGFNLFKNSKKVKIEKPYIATKYFSKGNIRKMLNPKLKQSDKRNNDYLKIASLTLNEDESTYEVRDGTKYTLIIYGIARGMRYLHNLKIDHRDIKTDNIFLDENDYPHIGDFGQSKQDEDRENSKKFAGAQFYADPYANPKAKGKNLQESQKYQQASDIYSLALIFFELYEFHLYPYSFFPEGKSFKSDKIEENVDSNVCTDKNLRKKLVFKYAPLAARNLIESMRDKDFSKRPNINEICLELEKNKYWFKNTNPTRFYKYKQKIDRFEFKHFPEFRGIKYLYYNELQDISLSLKEKNIDENEDDDWNQMKFCNNLMILNQSLNFNAGGCLSVMHLLGYFGFPKDVAFSYRHLIKLLKLSDLNAYAIHNAIINEIIKYEKQVNKDCLISSNLLKSSNCKSQNNMLKKKDEDEDDQEIPPESEEKDDNLNAVYIDQSEDSKESLEFITNIIPSSLQSAKGQLLMGMIAESLDFIEDSLALYTKSATQGLREARGRLGSLLFMRIGDYKRAEQLLISATGWDNETQSCKISTNEIKNIFNDTFINSNDECNISLFNLGLLYLYPNDKDDIIEKRQKARNIFMYLHRSGYPDAPYAIALSYHMDDDLNTAAEWYKRSYEYFANHEAYEKFNQINRKLGIDNANNS